MIVDDSQGECMIVGGQMEEHAQLTSTTMYRLTRALFGLFKHGV